MDGSGGMPSVEEMQMRQQQQQENEARRLSILDQILEPAAKSRLSRLAMVKKEHARSVEDSLINAATNGQLKSKISEEQLIAMLEQISGSAASGTAQNRGITIQRRKTGFDDEEDDDDSDLAWVVFYCIALVAVKLQFCWLRNLWASKPLHDMDKNFSLWWIFVHRSV